MINICLGHAFSGNGCDLISKDIFQLIAGNESASFLTNEEGRNFGSSPWGAIIIEARLFCCTCGGGETLAVWHIWLVMWRPHGLARIIGECLGKRNTLTLPTVRSHQIKTRRSKQVEHTLPALPCHYQTSARHCHVETVEQKENNKS